MLSHFSHVWLFAMPWTVAHQSPLSMGFSRQGYWSGLLCTTPRDLPDQRIEPASLMFPALAGRFFFTIRATWEAHIRYHFSSIQFSRSVVSDSLRSHESQHARPPCPSPTPGVHSNSTSIKSVMPSSHLILCHPLLLLPPIPPSIRVFSNESTLRFRWPKYWSFSFSITPSKEHPGLISFRMDWLDLLAVQGTLKSLLQHHSSKASILRHSAFFTVQLSHQYMTTGKTIALTRWTFVGKVMSLLLNMLSRLVITSFQGVSVF